MFGKRSGSVSAQVAVSRVASVSVVNEAPKPAAAQTAPVQTERRSETYFQTKSLIFGALIEAIDLATLSKLDPESARGNPRHRTRDRHHQEFGAVDRRAGRSAR